MPENLQKLENLLNMVDTKSTMEEFVQAFGLVVDHIKTFQDTTTADITAIFKALDDFAGKLKEDSAEDQATLKRMVGEAIAELRISLETKSNQLTEKIEQRLSEVKDGKDGMNGKDGESIVGSAGKDGSPDTPDQIIEKINKSNLTIAKERVEGLVDYIRMAAMNAASSMPVTTSFFNGLRGKNLTIVGGTATQQGDTVSISISGSGGGTVTNVSSANGDATVANQTTTPVITIVAAPALDSATTVVNVSSATAPTSGQVLTATSGTAATWQTPGGGSGTVTTVASADSSITVTNPTTTPDLAVAKAPKLTTARNIDGQAFDGTAAITVIAPGTHAATSKTTPVDADEIPLVDSAASNVLKKLTWANLKATIKTYTDSLYPSGSGTSTGTNTGDQTITLTGAVTGSGTGSFATTFATPGTLTVASSNSNATAHTHAITSSSAPGAAASLLATDSSGIIGSTGTRIVKGWFTDLTATNAIAGSVTGNAATVTTNANLTGPITSSGNATSVAAQTGTGSTFVMQASPTLTTAVLGSSTATTQTPADNSTKVATTAYVDAAVLGQNFKEAALVATTANLVGTYLSGVFTYTATGVDTIDGVALALGNRVLVKNQTTTFQNGIYTVTTAGAVGVAGILTRSTDANTSGQFKTGDSLFVTSGTAQSATTWAYTGVDSPTIGTDAITYAQAAGQGSFTSGNGITITGNSVAIDTSVTVDKTTSQTLTNKTLTSPTFTAPALGTPASGVMTNVTGVPAAAIVAGTFGSGSYSFGTGNAVTLGTIELGAASDTTIARSGAGAITVEGVQVLLSGAALGTPSSGTGTNITGIPAANILAGSFGAGAYVISTSLQAATIELGAATDTTLSRVSAGVIAVEGVTVDTISAANTLTNKTLTAPIMTAVAETGVGTADLLAPNNHTITVSSNAGSASQSFFLNTFTNSSASAMTITIPVTTPTPKDGQQMIIRIYDATGVAKGITWVNTENSTVTAPATSNGSTTLPLTVGFMYNAATSLWRCIASA